MVRLEDRKRIAAESQELTRRELMEKYRLSYPTVATIQSEYQMPVKMGKPGPKGPREKQDE